MKITVTMMFIVLSFSLMSVVSGRQNSSVQSRSLSVAIPKPAAFLQQADTCSCDFDEVCSCRGALDFMRCIRDGCESGACQCSPGNHFQNACEEMAEGCPGLGMECVAEEATCGGDSVTWYGKQGTPIRDEIRRDVAKVKEGSSRRYKEILPSGWEAMWSKEYQRWYYGNAETGEVTWTKPTEPTEEAAPAPKKSVDSDNVPKEHYKRKVKELHSHEHHIFAKGTITGALVLCLTMCFVLTSNKMISSNTYKCIDATITVFLALAWYYVIVHYLDFAHFKGLEKLVVHLIIATGMLLASSLIGWFMQRQATTDKAADMAASVLIFNTIFDPAVAWTNAGAVSVAQQLAKPSEFYVLVMTGAMVVFYVVLAVVWEQVVGRITKKGWGEGTITNLTGVALAAGMVLWVHMVIVGGYNTIEDPHPNAPGLMKTLVLNCFGLVYIVIACVATGPIERVLGRTDKETDYAKWRVLSVVKVFVCRLPHFSCVIGLGHLIIDNSPYQEGAIEARLICAVVSTLIGMGLIVLCAKVKALRDDKALSDILVDLGGFMVGAAWSGLLNNSITQMVKGYRHPFVSHLEITSLLTAAILPTYFYYLKPLIDAKSA